MVYSATAFVPGHVTGFFTVERGGDPTETGSTGAGIALTDGVEVTVEPSERRRLFLDDTTVEVDAVDLVRDALRADVRVSVTSDLPLGAGFGVSGAMALGTALATNTALDRGLSENELTAIAHGAEVQAGTGLGDVVAQARGGVPIRLEPGDPQHNHVDGIATRREVEYLVLGDLATEGVIEDDERAELVTAAGERALSRVVREPVLDGFGRAARQFSRESELLTGDVKAVIEDVNEAGGTAFMALLGESVVAFDRGLTDAGYDATACEIDPCGARLLP
jgi:pantoate kinase